MRFIFIIFGVVGLLAVAIVGAIWAVVMVTPLGILAGVAIFFFFRHDRRRKSFEEAVARDAERERELNRREYAAWHELAEAERQREAKRRQALRKFDSTHKPPPR